MLIPTRTRCMTLISTCLMGGLLTLAMSRMVCAQPAGTDLFEPAVQKLRQAVEFEVADKDLPALSISLIEGDREVWAAGFGFQDADRTVPATADTVYRVGSVSKLFTDIAVMQLVEQGVLDLDDPVQTYLPTFQPVNDSGTPITLRQLMSHLSGLVRESPVGNYFDPTEPTLAETIASLNRTHIVYPPGTRTKYSNAGVSVVGQVLHEKCGVSWSEQVDRTILQPLGMQNSSFAVTPAVQKRLADAWMWSYDGRRFRAPDFSLGTAPAGNLYSSVHDLATFASVVFNQGRGSSGPILKPETLQEMLTPVMDAEGRASTFGLGFHIQELDGHRKIGHGGAVYGYSTQLELLIEQKLGVAAVCSLDGANGVVGRLADYALRLMLATREGRPLPDYITTTRVPRQRAQDLVGHFQSGDRHAHVFELAGRVYLERGTYRYELKSLADTGETVIDDTIAFGTRVSTDEDQNLRIGDTVYVRVVDEVPPECPSRWNGLLGEYGWDHNTLYILEDHGRLVALIEWFYYYPLTEIDDNTFAFPDYGLYHGEFLKFERGSDGYAERVNAAEVVFERREVGTRDGKTFQITPVRPIAELREAALQASPPAEPGEFLPTDLVDLTSLDPEIRLDIRYATTNNFTGSVFYHQSRAFMQRPAAEAVVRVHQTLGKRGLGLMIHDAYRPWHVTKMFWDATPDAMKDFVADPSRGSRHNRGCAADLTLFDRATQQPIPMVAGYDEFSQRSFPMYPGGTSRQRWYRELLRRSMEAEGFQVYEFEWWHFDFQDWQKYRIGNQTFEEIQPPTN
ncbi:MAG: serine hydrolase [Planctomycetaceae bacterium]|nr:serine hydrolase [Planctomycetaceae bacterium]